MITIYKVRYQKIRKILGSHNGYELQENYKLFGSLQKAQEFMDSLTEAYHLLGCGTLESKIYCHSLELEE